MDDEFNHGRLKDIFDFFILKLFSAGPLSMFELRRRVQPLCNYLDLVALHAGKNASGALPSALQRLLTDGCLKTEQRLIEHVGPETVYSLTAAGTQRLQNESARQDAIVSQVVEDAELDKSFQKFLNRTGSPYGN
jgi:DNA-binding PadR family transcriptional regulator